MQAGLGEEQRRKPAGDKRFPLSFSLSQPVGDGHHHTGIDAQSAMAGMDDDVLREAGFSH